MSNYSEKEGACMMAYTKLGPCYHVWTPENFEIIFRCANDFQKGMDIMAISAKLFPDVKVITYELMTNHLHIMAAGELAEIKGMLGFIRRMLRQMTVADGRTINWNMFTPGIRQITDLNDARNVLIYDNRNGFLVRPDHTPFSYPWGANICFFNPCYQQLFTSSSTNSTYRERREITHSHLSDNLQGLRRLGGCISPLSFCDIEAGEHLFRDASHYFYLLGKSIEQNCSIAREIGESVSYTEEELYAAVCSRCKKEYGTINPTQISSEEKIFMAKLMHNEFNATTKQIQRMLRLDGMILKTLFGN